MDTLRLVSQRIFFTLGGLVILAVLLLQKDILTSLVDPLVSILDLPLLFVACVFAGTSFLSTIAHPPSRAMTIIVCTLLSVFFLGCLILNFAFPFQVYFGF